MNLEEAYQIVRDIEDKRKETVLDLSVYNALSIGLRRDAHLHELVGFLHAAWSPAWDSAQNVVTIEAVQQSVERLSGYGLIEFDSEQNFCSIRTRGSNGLGQPVGRSEDKLELVWRGKR